MKKLRNALTAVAIAAASIIGFSGSASAHTGNLNAAVTCVDGKQKVTYTLTLKDVPDNKAGTTHWKIGTPKFTGTPSNFDGLTNGPVATKGNAVVVLGYETYDGDYKGEGNWVYAYTEWSGASKGSDGRIDHLPGNCKPPTPTVPPTTTTQPPATTTTLPPACEFNPQIPSTDPTCVPPTTVPETTAPPETTLPTAPDTTVPPETSPPTTEAPIVVVAVTQPPVAPAAPVGQELPVTGAGSWLIAILAAIAVVGGAGIVRTSRRKK